ncbi:EbsA family protein [Lacticaseibacillus suibinensis]|uniref:EbsA family protein n=1 Tax=Lacticaseibacillus suibinensis TaxID=2486011 RepID=UPI000F791B37|nr:EbsA family protein [Lacticaseibacillus suibinensis]
MKKRFLIQPAWLDFSMFWAVIVLGISISVIVQMELVGYGPISWVAVVILLVTLLIAGLQVWRSQLIITDQLVTIRRLLPGNTLAVPPLHITAMQVGRNQIRLQTTDYGWLTLVHFGRQTALTAALESVILQNERG